MPPPTTPSSNKITQSELDDVIKKHVIFGTGRRGGARAVLKFKDLSGLYFHGADLSGADFTGSDLSRALLAGGKFNGANFYNCVMDQTDLTNCNFSRADLRGVDLTTVKMDGADFTGADRRGSSKIERHVTLSEQKQSTPIDKDKKETVIDYKNMGGEEIHRDAAVDLSRKAKSAESYSNLSLTPEEIAARASSLDLSNRQESDKRTSDLDLSKKKDEVVFHDTNFDLSKQSVAPPPASGLDLSAVDTVTGYNSNLDLSKKNDPSIASTGLDLSQSDIATRNSDLVLKGEQETSYVSNLDLSVQIQELEMMLREHAKWIHSAGKTGAQLDLSERDLQKFLIIGQYPLIMIKASWANFSRLAFIKAQMQSSNFDYCNFSGANMMESDFRGSSLKSANFHSADLSRCNFSALTLAPGRFLATNLSGANLRNANLSGARLKRANLSGADLTGANMTGADLREADLTGTILSENP